MARSRRSVDAEQAGGGLDSLCIKDMSGQLTPALALDLIPALKSLGLPVYLHCHSTDEARALGVQTVAIEAGISGIEVAVEPLAGGRKGGRSGVSLLLRADGWGGD